ncbi:hypothetical protein KKH59_05645 [Patescibacteria group bacterium]|nr:hypothetical protein [Patescibacteria group bacterium]
MAKRLIIIDSNSVIHRAFHALPPLTTKKGELVNAVYGFLLVFFKAIKEFQPDYIAACFDMPGPTFRHKKYKEYKANRPPTPKELNNQIPKVKEILEGFNVPVFEKQGFEADDIIGTLALRAAKFSRPEGARLAPPAGGAAKIKNIIISGDLDLLQLVDEQTEVYILRKGVKDTVLYDENLVKEKYGGLTSEQLLDFKALRGDPSDNIPGVKGVGEKTAVDLLLKFGSLENIYKEIGKNSEASEKAPKESKHPTGQAKTIKPKLKEALLKYKEQAFLSKDLARIEENVPVDFNLAKCQWKDYNKEKVTKILKDFEFYSLIERLKNFDTSQENDKIKQTNPRTKNLAAGVKVEPQSRINSLRGKQKTLFN